MPKAADPCLLSRHTEFGNYVRPSTSAVMERCFSTEATVSTTLIAVEPGLGCDIRKIYLER